MAEFNAVTKNHLLLEEEEEIALLRSLWPDHSYEDCHRVAAWRLMKAIREAKAIWDQEYLEAEKWHFEQEQKCKSPS